MIEGVGCQSSYPIAPTFCDDWCRATRLERCGQEPENCVEDCEQTKSSERCFGRQEVLLACYQGTERTDFFCAGEGFDAETRVLAGRCQFERDALFECEAPGIGQCLAACRVAQEAQLSQIEIEGGELVDFGLLGAASPPGAACPALDRPCEELCWSVFGLQLGNLPSSGFGSLAAGAPSGEEAADAGGVLECLQQSLLGCFSAPEGSLLGDAGAAAGAVDAGAARSVADVGVETFEDVLARCAAP